MAAAAQKTAEPAVAPELRRALAERGYADPHYRGGQLRARSPCSRCRGTGTIDPGTETERRCVFCRGTGTGHKVRSIDPEAILAEAQPAQAPAAQKPSPRWAEKPESALERAPSAAPQGREMRRPERVSEPPMRAPAPRPAPFGPARRSAPAAAAEIPGADTVALAIRLQHRRHTPRGASASHPCECLEHLPYVHPCVHDAALADFPTEDQSDLLRRHSALLQAIATRDALTNAAHQRSRRNRRQGWAAVEQIYYPHSAHRAPWGEEGCECRHLRTYDPARHDLAVALAEHRLPMTPAQERLLLGESAPAIAPDGPGAPATQRCLIDGFVLRAHRAAMVDGMRDCLAWRALILTANGVRVYGTLPESALEPLFPYQGVLTAHHLVRMPVRLLATVNLRWGTASFSRYTDPTPCGPEEHMHLPSPPRCRAPAH